MSLKREDFPTDELWEAYQAELDRARTQASKTARENAEKDAQRELQTKLEEARADERARLEASEAERLEMERKQMDADRAKFAAERKGFNASKKLLGAGFDEKEVESLLPMFVAVDDATLDTTLDAFITVNSTRIKAQVDAARQELLGNATAPNVNAGGPVDMSTQVQEQLAAGNEVAALDIMLTDAGYKS